MKDISKFGDVVGTPSRVGSIDPAGSTVDKFFAEAILAREPTTVLEERGVIRVQKVPIGTDKANFSIMRNTDITFTTIKRNQNDTGCDIGASVLNPATFKEVEIETKTANIFLPDNLDLVNPFTFDHYSEMLARAAKKQKEEDALSVLVDETGLNTDKIHVAGGNISGAAGSISTASTLEPMDLLMMQTTLSTGSDPYVPDFALMHREQYEQLNTHADFAPGASTNGAIMRKARFNQDGDIVRFSGMDILATELMPAGTGGYYDVSGHPVIVGTKGFCVGRAEWEGGIRVATEVSPRRHGQWKIVDMDYGVVRLEDESIGLIRAAD